MFLQQLFNGLSVGSIYALMAVGYSLIYSLLNFTNFAHSLTVTLGAFVAFFVTSTALQNLTVGILAAVAVAGAAAMLIQKTAYSPLLKKNVRRIYLTIAGLGTVTIGENLMIIGFTGRFRAYPVNFSSDMISIFGASVGEVDLIIFLLSVVALVAVEILIQKTRFGLAIRGASYDFEYNGNYGSQYSASHPDSISCSRLFSRTCRGAPWCQVHGIPHAWSKHDK